MDDQLFEELTGIKDENNELSDDSTVGTIEENECWVISSSDGLEEKLYKTITLSESKLEFKNFFEFIEFINNNIYLKDDYYCLKIKYNSYNIEWVFRNKETIFKNIMRTFQLEHLFNYYINL